MSNKYSLPLILVFRSFIVIVIITVVIAKLVKGIFWPFTWTTGAIKLLRKHKGDCEVFTV